GRSGLPRPPRPPSAAPSRPRPAPRRANGKRSRSRLVRSWLVLAQNAARGVDQEEARASPGIEVSDAPLAQEGGTPLGGHQRPGGFEPFLRRAPETLECRAGGQTFPARLLPRELHRNEHVQHGLLAALRLAPPLHCRDAFVEDGQNRRALVRG